MLLSFTILLALCFYPLQISLSHYSVEFGSVACVQCSATQWTAACQASLSITNSRSLLKLISIESVMPSNLLITCHPLFLLPSIFPSIRVFSNELALFIRWPKYRTFSFSISPSNEYLRLISFRISFRIKFISTCQIIHIWHSKISYKNKLLK